MLTRGAHHVSLIVADIARSREFYGGLLGLEEIERPDFGFPGAWYQAGSVQVHLLEPPPGRDAGRPPAELTPLAAHLAFEVLDYEATAAKFEAAGMPMMGLGAEVGQLFVRDPDGNVLEFIQPGGKLGRQSDDGTAAGR
jgi:catechol 2,3-dioxygenase-like lactoylglutathione lyase family enzyme